MFRYYAKIDVSKSIDVFFKTPLFTEDFGNKVCLDFFLRGEPYTAISAMVFKDMTDGTASTHSVSMNNNSCIFTIPNVMHNVAGETTLQIVLLDNEGSILTSGLIHFEVMEGCSGKTQVQGTDQYNDMTSLLKQVSDGIKQIERAEMAAVKAEAAADSVNADGIFKFKGEVFSYNSLPSDPICGEIWKLSSGVNVDAYSIRFRIYGFQPGDYEDEDIQESYTPGYFEIADIEIMNKNEFVAVDGSIPSTDLIGTYDLYDENFVSILTGGDESFWSDNVATISEASLLGEYLKKIYQNDYEDEYINLYITWSDESYISGTYTKKQILKFSNGDLVQWLDNKWNLFDTNSENIIVLSNQMTVEQITETVNNAHPGTLFDIQTSLELYDVNISFPEMSVVYSSTANRKNITFGYSDTSDPEVGNQSWYLSFGAFSKISDIYVSFSDNGTANVGVNFGEGCNVTNCSFSGYSPFDWRDNCTFVNCVLSYYVYSLSNGGSYIGCNFDYTDIYEGIDLRNVYLSDCSCKSFKVNNNTLAIAAKIKALNPGMNLVDSEDNEIKGLYATADDVSSMIDSAVGLAMEGEY